MKILSSLLVSAGLRLAAVASIGLLSVSPCCAQDAAGLNCPLLLPVREVKVEIKEISFLESVEGLKVPQDKKDKFRVAVVTLQIEKPAGRSLEVAAADLTLHYRYATGVEVAPCEGISAFNQTLSEDRPMKMFNTSGPGWVKQKTGVRSSQASVVYLDAVFHLIEPTISEVWLCVAQPSKPLPFKTKGWSP